MGRRNYKKKNAAILDSDDADSVSSSSTVHTDNMLVSKVEEVLVDTDSLLDQSLDALYEKRGSTREKALLSIIETFNNNLPYEFIEKKFASLLHQCLNSVKKGSAKETCLASHVIGLLALTTGPGEKAQEILDESFTTIVEALKMRPEITKISSLLECLAVVTFVGGEDPEETEKSMQIIWQVAHPKLSTDISGAKPSPAVITMVVSAWSFLLSTMDGRNLNPESWQESMTYLSSLLDKDDRSLRITVGEALALIFETGNLEKFCKISGYPFINKGSDSQKLIHIHGLRTKIHNQVRELSTESGGKGSAKKDLTIQRNTFRDILDFLEDGYTPASSTKIGGDSIETNTWAELMQLNFLKHFLRGGFLKHMKENHFLQNVLCFTPKNKLISAVENHLSNGEKRMYKSPNSALNKARTQLLSKQRLLSQDKKSGHYAIGFGDD